MVFSLRTVLLCSAIVPILQGQAPLNPDLKKQLDYTRSHYTKYEYRIPMRDGIRLFTSIYVPKDLSQPYPIIMQRTP
jgi:uncharacterized protein